MTFILSEKFVYVFMWVTLFLGFIEALLLQRWSLVFLIILTAILISIPTILHRRYDFTLPRGIVLMAMLFAYTSLFLGEIYDFYEKFWWWDVLLHGASAVGFALISLGIVRMMQTARVVDASLGLLTCFAFGFTLAIGTLWEIFEFAMDQLFGRTMQDNSLVDTMSDLIIDSIGALIVCLAGYLHWKYGRKNFIGHAVERLFQKYLQ